MLALSLIKFQFVMTVSANMVPGSDVILEALALVSEAQALALALALASRLGFGLEAYLIDMTTDIQILP
jgi:hypothetical protein